jgi:hypothetical protein
VHPYLVKSLLIHYHIIFSLILYTFKCDVVGKINNLSFYLSFYETIPGIAQCSTKKITKKYSNNYLKKVTESVKFRGISRNYMTRNSGEFRRNFSQFRTEYGIDGSKKNRRNSVSTEFRGHPTHYKGEQRQNNLINSSRKLILLCAFL